MLALRLSGPFLPIRFVLTAKPNRNKKETYKIIIAGNFVIPNAAHRRKNVQLFAGKKVDIRTHHTALL